MRRFKLPRSVGSRMAVALVLLAASIAIIVLGLRGQLTGVKSVLIEPFVPLQAFLTERYNTVAAALNPASDITALRTRNAELEQQVAQLTEENIRLKDAEAQLKIVSALLDYARTNPERDYLAASVVGRDQSLFLRFLLLDKGSRNGVQRRMPVVTDKGLVGVITEVTANASKVLLITDSSSAVNVRLEESRAEGVVSGQESGELRLNFISVDVNMEPGDRVLTSGLGGQYPAGLLVGTVASVRRRTFDVFQEADVTTAVDFNALETVLIITNFEPPELAPLLGTATPAP